jgi:uncharacterized membrane protein
MLDAMSEQQPPTNPDPIANPGSNFSGNSTGNFSGGPSMSPGDVKDGKVFAILSYVLNFLSVPFFLLPLIIRNNDFALYHAKQCLMLWLFAIIGYAIAGVLFIICIGPFVALAVFLASLVFNIVGLINSINERALPLPIIGTYAEQWFAGIKKV